MDDDKSFGLLRPDTIAKELGVTADAVYKWCQRGLLTHYRLGRCVRIQLGDLERFLKERRIEKRG